MRYIICIKIMYADTALVFMRYNICIEIINNKLRNNENNTSLGQYLFVMTNPSTFYRARKVDVPLSAAPFYNSLPPFRFVNNYFSIFKGNR